MTLVTVILLLCLYSLFQQSTITIYSIQRKSTSKCIQLPRPVTLILSIRSWISRWYRLDWFNFISDGCWQKYNVFGINIRCRMRCHFVILGCYKKEINWSNPYRIDRPGRARDVNGQNEDKLRLCSTIMQLVFFSLCCTHESNTILFEVI